MLFGIKRKENKIVCANCGKLISVNGEYNDNFCNSCGNPLVSEAADIRYKEYEIENIKLIYEFQDKIESGLYFDKVASDYLQNLKNKKTQ